MQTVGAGGVIQDFAGFAAAICDGEYQPVKSATGSSALSSESQFSSTCSAIHFTI